MTAPSAWEALKELEAALKEEAWLREGGHADSAHSLAIERADNSRRLNKARAAARAALAGQKPGVAVAEVWSQDLKALVSGTASSSFIPAYAVGALKGSGKTLLYAIDAAMARPSEQETPQPTGFSED